ncbi:ABC transporter permease [Lentibacillus sp. Marseille-P4043]|uniref:ABC transporter permease n=1 Tax=Lentibacillus sp. Marseille-P4043 TaxID=2040293 RepID=UPI000D0BD72B|nr:ABC transporter permease [Lentibacillus sp. Marseille-P4043]
MKGIIEKGWKPLVVILLLFSAWELSSILFDIPDWLLPAPSQIVQTGIEGWPMYQHHLVSTITLSVVGLLIGVSVGILVAICLHLVSFIREAFFPLMILSQNIPIIVLAPLLVIWFGFGVLPKIIVITLVCFFPVAVAALDGFRQTDRDLLHYAQMAGANKRQIFTKLEIPSALPSLFSGLKISATYSVMGAVISEWLGANEGIGVYMTLASSSFRTDRVFVAIFFVMILSLLFFSLIAFLEKRILSWKSEGN